MKKTIFITYLLINAINTYANPIDIPEKTILSKEDLYLKGKVKTLNISIDSLVPQGTKNLNIMTIHFYENGLVKKIDSSLGDSGQAFIYNKTFTQLIQHESFYNSNPEIKSNHLIGLVKDYTDHFPNQIIYSPPQATNLIAVKKNITFKNNIETIETFSLHSPFNLKLTSKVSNFYDPKTHQLMKSIKYYPSIFKQDDFNKIEVNYNAFGKTSIINDHGHIEFYYKDHELIKEVSSDQSNSETLYSDYQYDQCANWTSRKALQNKQTSLQNRNFTYYEQC